MAFGVAGVVRSLQGPELSSYVRWWIGGLLANDAFLAPGAAIAGIVLARLVPAHVRPPLQAAGYVSATIVLATLPLLLGHGRQPDNPSLQPNDYSGNVLLVVGLVWAVGTAMAIRRVVRAAEATRADASADPPR